MRYIYGMLIVGAVTLAFLGPSAYPKNLKAEQIFGRTVKQLEKILGQGEDISDKEGQILVEYKYKKGAVSSVLCSVLDTRPFDNPKYGTGPISGIEFSFVKSTSYPSASKLLGISGTLSAQPAGMRGDDKFFSINGTRGPLAKVSISWILTKSGPVLSLEEKR